MLQRRSRGAPPAARFPLPSGAGQALALALIVALALAAGLATAFAELTYPALTGRVVDAAHILDPATVAALEARLAAQEAKTTDQVVVATVPSLQGTSVEDYANRLFRAWQIGQKTKNNGVLLLVAPNERKVRIEAGYGLEGILTDAVSSLIIRNAIVPSFKAGDMAGGVRKGTDAVLEVLNLDPAEARDRAKRAEEPATSDEDWFNLILLFIMTAVWAYILWRASRGGGNGRGGSPGAMAGRRRGADPWASGPITTWDWGQGRGGWSGGGGGWSGGGGWGGGGGSSGGGGASGGW